LLLLGSRLLLDVTEGAFVLLGVGVFLLLLLALAEVSMGSGIVGSLLTLAEVPDALFVGCVGRLLVLALAEMTVGVLLSFGIHLILLSPFST
jgi:hypothetical protein